MRPPGNGTRRRSGRAPGAGAVHPGPLVQLQEWRGDPRGQERRAARFEDDRLHDGIPDWTCRARPSCRFTVTIAAARRREARPVRGHGEVGEAGRAADHRGCAVGEAPRPHARACAALVDAEPLRHEGERARAGRWLLPDERRGVQAPDADASERSGQRHVAPVGRDRQAVDLRPGPSLPWRGARRRLRRTRHPAAQRPTTTRSSSVHAGRRPTCSL